MEEEEELFMSFVKMIGEEYDNLSIYSESYPFCKNYLRDWIDCNEELKERMKGQEDGLKKDKELTRFCEKYEKETKYCFASRINKEIYTKVKICEENKTKTKECEKNKKEMVEEVEHLFRRFEIFSTPLNLVELKTIQDCPGDNLFQKIKLSQNIKCVGSRVCPKSYSKYRECIKSNMGGEKKEILDTDGSPPAHPCSIHAQELMSCYSVFSTKYFYNEGYLKK